MLLGGESGDKYNLIAIRVRDACMAPTVRYHTVYSGNTERMIMDARSNALALPSSYRQSSVRTSDLHTLYIRPPVEESSDRTVQIPLIPLQAPRHSKNYVGRHWHPRTQSSFNRMSRCTMFVIATIIVGTISFVAGVLTAVVRFVASN